MAGLPRNRGPRAPLLRRSFDAFPADAHSDPSMTTIDASSTHEVAVALPLMVSLVMTLATIVTEAIALIGILSFIRYHHRLGRTGVWFWQDVTIVSSAIMLAGVAHLVEIFIWAVVFVSCGRFGNFQLPSTAPRCSIPLWAPVKWLCPRHGNCWDPLRQRMGCWHSACRPLWSFP